MKKPKINQASSTPKLTLPRTGPGRPYANPLDYILHVKNVKQWKPKTIRQTAASAKIFFLEMIGHEDWKVFSQVKTKDQDELPLVLTRPASHAS